MRQTPNRKTALAAVLVVLCALTGHAQAQGQPQPSTPAAAPAAASADLSGTYKCQPNPNSCVWSGPSPSISQSGKALQIKGDNGATADATLTSDSTISAGGTFNSWGIVRPDHSIDWSDGTKWSK